MMLPTKSAGCFRMASSCVFICKHSFLLFCLLLLQIARLPTRSECSLVALPSSPWSRISLLLQHIALEKEEGWHSCQHKPPDQDDEQRLDGTHGYAGIPPRRTRDDPLNPV